MFQRILWLDHIIGWPFRKILTLLVKITGQDNLWHARYILVLSGSITATQGILTYRENPSAQSMVIIGVQGILGFVAVICGYLYTRPSHAADQSGNALDPWVIGIRMLIALVAGIYAPQVLYNGELNPILGNLANWTFAAGFYFLSDPRPKSPGWISKLASLLNPRPGQAEPT